MRDDLVTRLRVEPTASQFLKPAHLYQDLIAERAEAANRIEADAKLIQEMREALHGPYGWLTGNIGLNAEYWTVEADEVKDGEFFSIPLYAKVDPIALSKAKSQQEGET